MNTRGWVFPNVHQQYLFWLTVTSRSKGDGAVRWSGPFTSESEFLGGEGRTASVPSEEFASWGEGAAFPSLPATESLDVLRQLKLSPRFDSVRPGWAFRATRELDATNDKKLLEFDIDEPRDRTPVFTGGTFNLWEPDAGALYAYAPTAALRSHLEPKTRRAFRSARSAYHGMSLPNGRLPMDRARIAFRDVTNSENFRTTIACLLPPGVTSVNAAPFVVTRDGGVREEAFLLGVMSSVPFDWASRRWVERHLNFWILNPLPVPIFEPASSLGSRAVEVAGRLAAVDDRYVEWADELGVATGSVAPGAEKDDLLAELDALVCLLYGLKEDHVEHVFSTFHRSWDYEARLEAVLEHYRGWKGQA